MGTCIKAPSKKMQEALFKKKKIKATKPIAYIVLVCTEDSERYYYIFKNKPTEKVIKKMFFEENDIYDIEEWGICISYEIIKRNINQ